MKKPEAWTAYDQGDPVYVYDVSEADEYSNALEAALAEAVALLKVVKSRFADHHINRFYPGLSAFLDKHGGEDQ